MKQRSDRMGLTFIRYYILKDTMKFISNNIKSSIDELSNHDFFKYALFYDVSKFYRLFKPFKTDPYQITDHIHNDFIPFFKDCLEHAYLDTSEEQKLFCYFILESRMIELVFRPYITALQTKKKNASYIEKNLEAYYFKKNENVLITKINLADYFFDSFSLSNQDLDLLDKPVKRNFGFFCSKQYFQSCYYRAKQYYDHLCRSKFGINKAVYILYDTLLNHKKGKIKAKNYLYHKKIDTTLLNLSKTSYTIDDMEVNLSLEEVYDLALKYAKEACNALNTYFNFDQNEKPLNNLLQRKSLP